MVKLFRDIKELFHLSVPLVISSVSITILGFLSIPILGNFSVNAMAAAAVTASIHLILINVFLAAYLGFRVLGSKALGRKAYLDVQNLFSSMITSSFFIGLVLCCFLSHASYQIIKIYHLSPEVSDLSIRMMKIYAMCYPVIAFNQSLASLFFINQKTKICMSFSIVGEVVGIALAFALVHGFYMIKGIGATGVAVAAFIQQLTELILYLYAFRRQFGTIKIRANFNFQHWKRIYSISFPSIISMFFDYLGTLLIFFMIANFLNIEELASGRIAFSISLFFFSIICSLSSGFFILGAKSLGNNMPDVMIEKAKANQLLLSTASVLMGTTLCFLSTAALSIFTKFETVQNNLKSLLVYVALSTFLISIWYNFSVILRIFEKTKYEMFANIFSIWCIQIPAAYALGIECRMGINGFFIGVIMADISYFILNSIGVFNLLRNSLLSGGGKKLCHKGPLIH